MFELGGITVTWGMLVLALAVVAVTAWIVRRKPSVVALLLALVGIVHAVAYWTTYLDANAVESARESALELATGAFLGAAGALDTALGTVREAIVWALDWLAGVSMPETSVSLLEFATFLGGVVVVSALVCVALVRISHWTAGTPIGEWLAALGVVFGATGILWTWLPMAVGELSALLALSIVLALGIGVAIAAVAVRIPTPALRKRVRPHR